MARGLDGQNIFHDDEDRKKLAALLGKYLQAGQCACYAWVFMDNHYHLLLRPREPDLGGIMRKVNGAYARRFNSRHHRRGYLFQDRYKSLATQECTYLRELIRYIHLNPLRAGLVKSVDALGRYQWSGHAAMLGLATCDWHDSESALWRFGARRSTARREYMDYLQQGAGCELHGWRFGNSDAVIDAEQDADERLAGDAAFVRCALQSIREPASVKREAIRRRPSLDQILFDTCEEMQIDAAAALGRGRNDLRSAARSEFCRAATRDYYYTFREVAVFLGINASSVSRLCWRAAPARATKATRSQAAPSQRGGAE